MAWYFLAFLLGFAREAPLGTRLAAADAVPFCGNDRNDNVRCSVTVQPNSVIRNHTNLLLGPVRVVTCVSVLRSQALL